MALETLLFGQPLSKRSNETNAADCAVLNQILTKVIGYLNDEYPLEAEGRRHAVYEIGLIAEIPDNYHAALICKRMAVGLFFMRENAAALRLFGGNEADRRVITNLGRRFYPLLIPVHVQHLAQRPDRFTRACSVLWGCWKDADDVAVMDTPV